MEGPPGYAGAVSVHLLALLVVASGVAYALWKRREQGALHRLLERQAQERGGEVERGTLLYYPKMIYSRHGAAYTVSALLGGGTPDRRAATTYVAVRLAVRPGPAFRIAKRTKSVQSLVDGWLADSRIETHDPAFDAAFVVESEDAVATRHFLTHDVQRTLLAFDETVDVRFDGEQLLVKVDEIVDSEATLGRMLELAELGHDTLRSFAIESGTGADRAAPTRSTESRRRSGPPGG